VIEHRVAENELQVAACVEGCDREGDFYEHLVDLALHKDDYVIRAQVHRDVGTGVALPLDMQQCLVSRHPLAGQIRLRDEVAFPLAHSAR
jgi:hypothetical protein